MRKSLPILLALFITACSGVHKKGGYFEDDGPPKRASVDIASIDNAVPRAEPLSKYGNRPYIVHGKTYYPLKDANGYKERGIASWYGKKFHGRRTSSGEPYDMYAMTAAHKTLPLPSYVRVQNLKNGRLVIVRLNDRGPFVDNRVIDLSFSAATKLGIVGAGTGIVEVAVVAAATTELPDPAPAPTAQIHVPPRLYLQVGAFTSRENAANLQSRLRTAQLGPIFITSKFQGNVRMFRVRVGPLASVAESDRLVQRAMAYGIADAHIVIE
ncbi:MAG: septal ring lytic transglycosylase RlpA family protein [Gammaproteobacteria bacterium]|jgi:rare lipoprotein A|nr:septal ring lytic transglycosylase RlpA family protein [Pseudomonadota bacterium]MCZ6732117.1 septal ring lytic transglycosylase RlpA family protein [Gammaproteobacteria bacterium]